MGSPKETKSKENKNQMKGKVEMNEEYSRVVETLRS
jgi:hypothetical protein